MLGELGFDFVFLDGEHGATTPTICRELQRAADVVGIETIVRVPHNDGPSIVPYLDAGVCNLIVPHVNTPEAAELAVQAASYAPRGFRGAAASTRAARFGQRLSVADYFVEANKHIMVLPMIEEVEALSNLEAIAAVDGIHGAFVGAQDLSLSMNLPGRTDNERVRDAADDAIRRLRAAGMIVGAPAGSVEEARRIVALGAQLIVTSAAGFLARAAREFLTAARA
jgi:4-hydroxy-2-oxoheptanedioate aldolase